MRVCTLAVGADIIFRHMGSLIYKLVVINDNYVRQERSRMKWDDEMLTRSRVGMKYSSAGQ